MYEIKIELGAKRTNVVVYEEVPYGIPKEKIYKNKKFLTEEEKRKRREAYSKGNYWSRLKQRRDTFKELVYNNFEPPIVSLVTLTFDESKRGKKDYTKLEQAHYEFKKFIARMNNAYVGFAYVGVFGRQENGNWHYHILCNLDRTTTNEDIAGIWRLGYVWIDYIETMSELHDKVSYCIRNMQESGLAELQGKKGYLYSKELNRNIVLRTWKKDEEQRCEEIFEEIKDKPKKLLYTATKVQGIKADTVNTETGEIRTYYENQIQWDESMANAGYEQWNSNFSHISSSVKYSQLFKMLPKAEKIKKSKR